MPETKARFLAHLTGATSSDNNFTLPDVAISGTTGKVLTSSGNGSTTWEETVTSPSITNVTGEINENTNTTLTVTGSNFADAMTLKLINSSSGADITGHTALSYTSNNTYTTLTVTIPSATTNLTGGLQVKLNINKQGLTATSSQVITVSEDPVWDSTFVSNKATFATISETLNASSGGQTVGTLNASDPAGGTVVYASDDSSLDTTYFSLASNGVITTTSTALTGLTGSGNYTEAFNANAKIGDGSVKNTLLSGINIIIQKEPTSTNSGSGTSMIGKVETYTGYKLYVWTSVGTHSGSFVLYYPKTVDILLVAGGGGGGATFASGGRGGGGGAGGYRLLTSTSLVAGTYNIKVGHGGAGAAYDGTVGENGAGGGDSYVELSGSTQYKANGGGGGGGVDVNGFTGGSGGGAGSYGGGSRNGGQGNEGGFQPTPEGYNGGTSSGGSTAGGGGGATGAGGNNGSPASGGAGATTNIRDGSTNVTYSTGGQGGNSSATAGSANTGNGGDGHATTGGSGKDGGSGIVIIRHSV